MRSYILVAIFAVAIIAAFITFSWRKSKAMRAFLFQLSLVVTILSGLLGMGFESQSKKIYTSSERKSSQTFELVTFKNTPYYLIKNGAEYHYRYIDRNGEAHTGKVDTPECEVIYDKNSPKLTMDRVDKTYHEEWFFISGEDSISTEVCCSFIIPSEESILDLNNP